MERTAKKENRTISELIRELYRRYVSDEARREFGRALENLRTEAARTPAGKLTMRQIDAEIAASRRERRRRAAR
jgi:DNA transposition AAA+ family ATPase